MIFQNIVKIYLHISVILYNFATIIKVIGADITNR